MRKLGRTISIFLFLLTIAVCSKHILPKAYAASEMTVSESCVQFVKKVEGFAAKPYYDYSQHTVGYGTKCPSDKYFDYMANGISQSEAEALLQEALADIGSTIHKKLIEKYNLTFTQHQFDALVSFSFNIGTSWMTYDSTLLNAILTNADDSEFVYAFSLYCTAGGKYSSGLITRRLCEANMYLNGVYSQKVSDAYGYVYYDANGGSLTYRVQGYMCENNTAPIADAVRSGDVFLGWYTNINGGTQVTGLNQALTGKTLFARWQSSENDDSASTNSTVVKVTGDVVNIRKGPGTNYAIATQVSRNKVLVVSHVTHLTNMKWGKVQDGWICLDYTNYDAVINGSDGAEEETQDQPTVDATEPDHNTEPSTGGNQNVVSGIVRVNDALKIRSGPGTNYETVGHLYNGRSVEILEQKTVDARTWGKITRGWVCMDYIVTDYSDSDQSTESDAVQEETKEPEQGTVDSSEKIESSAIKGKITADALRIRSAASTASSIVGFYYQNDVVEVYEKVLIGADYWGKTSKGWINMDYVLTDSSVDETTQPTENATMTVIADCLRVRKAIGTDQRIAALLYCGDKVTVLETKVVDGVGWGRVDKGWICMDYVK